MMERHEAQMIRQQRKDKRLRHTYNALQYLSLAIQQADLMELTEETTEASRLIREAYALIGRSIPSFEPGTIQPEPFDIAVEALRS